MEGKNPFVENENQWENSLHSLDCHWKRTGRKNVDERRKRNTERCPVIDLNWYKDGILPRAIFIDWYSLVVEWQHLLMKICCFFFLQKNDLWLWQMCYTVTIQVICKRRCLMRFHYLPRKWNRIFQTLHSSTPQSIYTSQHTYSSLVFHKWGMWVHLILSLPTASFPTSL